VPELFWQLRESVRGLAEACVAFETPVTGGNCSLYNQSPRGPIDPTPTVAMVGLVDRPEDVTTQWFKTEGDAILLLGELVDRDDPLQGLGGSAYLQVCRRLKSGRPPRCRLPAEKTLQQALLAWIQSGIIRSAHDCSEGGLLVALAESCLSRQVARQTPRWIGAELDLSGESGARLDATLFGETQGRVLVSTPEYQVPRILGQARILELPARRVGTVGGDTLRVRIPSGVLECSLSQLHDVWWNAIARAMDSEVERLVATKEPSDTRRSSSSA